MQDTSLNALPGHLYTVATPIGNLGDISVRALSILKTCDVIACEDTRVSSKLLAHFNFSKPLISYRDANEQEACLSCLKKLQSGSSIALISDAGTPTISDPGFRLVNLCQKAKVPVVPIPGPCAFVTALSASGLPCHAFFFGGFLAPKKSARLRFFEAQKEAPHSIILYESCHRIVSFLEDLITVFGPLRTICIARELTKRFETFLIGASQDVLYALKKSSQKGEFVVIIAPSNFSL